MLQNGTILKKGEQIYATKINQVAYKCIQISAFILHLLCNFVSLVFKDFNIFYERFGFV